MVPEVKASNEADRLRAQLPFFKRKVARALSLISQASDIGRIGISVSGGKDSIVTLDLIRQIAPNSPAAFFDSGAEWQETYDIIRAIGIETFYPEWSLPAMLKYGGYCGYANPVDPDAVFDFKLELVEKPSYAFTEKYDIHVLAMGLRAQESTVRYFNAKQRGELYPVKADGLYHLCPLAYWTDDDVWAYISSRELVYHPVYDYMAINGIPRSQQRIGPLFGDAASGMGRYAIIKAIAPNVWNGMVAEFPKISIYA